MADKRFAEFKFVLKADSTKAFVEGRFVSGGQRAMIADNTNAAITVQGLVGQYMRKSYLRPNVATGFYVGVGDPAFLDSSTAKYWRFVEQGSAEAWGAGRFTSLQLVGVFGATNIGGRAGPAYSLPQKTGRGAGGKFRPIPINPETGEARFGKTPLRPFSPRRETKPMGAYGYAYYNSRFTLDMFNASAKYINTVLGQNIIALGSGFSPPKPG
jgi:hypothetical protein